MLVAAESTESNIAAATTASITDKEQTKAIKSNKASAQDAFVENKR